MTWVDNLTTLASILMGLILVLSLVALTVILVDAERVRRYHAARYRWLMDERGETSSPEVPLDAGVEFGNCLLRYRFVGGKIVEGLLKFAGWLIVFPAAPLFVDKDFNHTNPILRAEWKMVVRDTEERLKRWR